MQGDGLLEALFVSRTYHLRLEMAAENRRTGSRIGGAPPEVLADRTLTCPLCGRGLRYYLTVESDLLSCEVCARGALSVFYCPDEDCLLHAQHYVVPSSLVCLPHERSPRASSPTPMDSPFDALALVSGEVERDRVRFGDYEQGSKVGGKPGLVHDERLEDLKRLEQDDMQFLFQIDEEDYPRGVPIRRFPFRFGSLYVFCRGRPGEIPRDVRTCAPLWDAP